MSQLQTKPTSSPVWLDFRHLLNHFVVLFMVFLWIQSDQCHTYLDISNIQQRKISLWDFFPFIIDRGLIVGQCRTLIFHCYVGRSVNCYYISFAARSSV